MVIQSEVFVELLPGLMDKIRYKKSSSYLASSSYLSLRNVIPKGFQHHPIEQTAWGGHIALSSSVWEEWDGHHNAVKGFLSSCCEQQMEFINALLSIHP